MRTLNQLVAPLASQCRAGFGGPQPTRMWRGVKRHADIVIAKGSGSEVWTTDGKRYLDATAGIGVLSTGHGHPVVAKAVLEQCTKLVHAQQSVYFNETTNRLMDRLMSVVPNGLDSFFFANSGAEAVEAAMKLARQATGRDTIIAFVGGYHGRTAGTLAVTTSSAAYRGSRSGPLPGGTAFALYPYEHIGITVEKSFESLDTLLLQQAPSSDVAAALIEPVLGEGGYVQPPPGYLERLRTWCSSHDILLIADEVQCGYGRTGKQWAVDHSGVVPDLLVTAKGIASGYPLSMVVARQPLSDLQRPGCMGGTYGGNVVACAAALATLDVFEHEGVVENARLRGLQLLDGLREVAQLSRSCTDVRGIGLMVGMEFDEHVVSKGFAADVSKECFARGLLVLTAGHREVLRFIPPLIITAAEVDEIVDVVGQALTAAEEKVVEA